jgi:threonine aldolase
MLSFESDYLEGAHEAVLQRLIETNREQVSGYGNDKYCESAKAKIKEQCKCPEAEVYFLVGGTQTNKTVIGTMLKAYEGVIAAATGHISTHEAGAIENTGHKVLEIKGCNGKLEAASLKKYLSDFYADRAHEHMVFPGMVYISYPTEYGTLYTRSELTELSSICSEYKIPLYLDGARLGYGLTSEGTDVSLPDIARLCDVFYIGGTKGGALCGEALVFTKNNAPAHFTNLIKKHGALLAKGRLLGVQFDALFTDDLYYKISRHAIEMAKLLRDAFKSKNYSFFIDSPSNQLFIVLDNIKMAELSEKVSFSFWERLDDSHTVVRFATSWATTEEAVSRLIALI